eukprot:TRINITY_DN127981_c0_g1_i3.p1 TRINITY_DN127981_c0_g1~~TRINITY_DN127981_c0_g1_i3.p1  ORF type:complete len:473 (-),score=134.13 TRINITY_DN127981_c0_g1_i3:70-1299(-)
MKYSSHVITPEAQWKLERLNKGFIVHLDEMWKRHVQKRFGISTIPADFKTWKQYFKHLVKEDKQQSKLVSKKLGLSLSSREKKSSQITEIPSETDRRNMRTVTKQKQRTVVKRARSPQTIGRRSYKKPSPEETARHEAQQLAREAKQKQAAREMRRKKFLALQAERDAISGGVKSLTKFNKKQGHQRIVASSAESSIFKKPALSAHEKAKQLKQAKLLEAAKKRKRMAAARRETDIFGDDATIDDIMAKPKRGIASRKRPRSAISGSGSQIMTSPEQPMATPADTRRLKRRGERRALKSRARDMDKLIRMSIPKKKKTSENGETQSQSALPQKNQVLKKNLVDDMMTGVSLKDALLAKKQKKNDGFSLGITTVNNTRANNDDDIPFDALNDLLNTGSNESSFFNELYKD